MTPYHTARILLKEEHTYDYIETSRANAKLKIMPDGYIRFIMT